jgi:hypothetical protein
MRLLLLAVFIFPAIAHSQSVSRFVPQKIEPAKKYVFYLHGRIVQEQENPVSKEYGLYDYPAIVKALQSPDYHLITERRAKGTEMSKYAGYVKAQIDTLISKGVLPEKIYVVGASMGAGITMAVSQLANNKNLNFAILALCSPDVFPYAKETNLTPCGNFLSIYENTDDARSCHELFKDQTFVSGFKEVRLDMKNRHGFIYQPYKEWVDPLKKWVAGILH